MFMIAYPNTGTDKFSLSIRSLLYYLYFNVSPKALNYYYFFTTLPNKPFPSCPAQGIHLILHNLLDTHWKFRTMSTRCLFSTASSPQMYIWFVSVIDYCLISCFYSVSSPHTVHLCPQTRITNSPGSFCGVHAVIRPLHAAKLCFKVGPRGRRMEILIKSGSCAAKFSRTENQPASLVAC